MCSNRDYIQMAASREKDRPRVTLLDLDRGIYDHDGHCRLNDRGMRRYHPFAFVFDSTPLDLKEPEESWSEEATKLHLANQAKTIQRLSQEYGSGRIKDTTKDARDLGSNEFSLLAHHNEMHLQARSAFISGAYYPALVAACAIGERILNHLILDLREDFRSSPHYRKVYRRDSFDNWQFAVDVLTDWGVLVEGAGDDFLALSKLRNRSIHFNSDTYVTMRDDALEALKTLGRIIGRQFGIGRQPWFIKNTPGAMFISREWESHPFVRTYLIPLSGYVGPEYGMEFDERFGWRHLDYHDYGDGELDDDAFAKSIRESDGSSTATRKMLDDQAQAPSRAN